MIAPIRNDFEKSDQFRKFNTRLTKYFVIKFYDKLFVICIRIDKRPC